MGNHHQSHLEEEEEDDDEEDEPVLPKSEREAKALQGARNGQPTVDREMASDVSRSHRRPRGDAESNARDDCDGGDAEFVVEWPARVWKDDVRARFGANATWGSVERSGVGAERVGRERHRCSQE